ncbi:hypothetical protein GCM10009001_25150 [Virgibacillus siamensis]|uniref:DUF3592 domain-containing protein n=1 Tax=Virgibacillus siamensis TaxID=480071 RepID=A0ABN1G9J2_9BACI
MEIVITVLILAVPIIALVNRFRGKQSSGGTNYTPASDIFEGTANTYGKEQPPGETTRKHAYVQEEPGTYTSEDYMDPPPNEPFNDAIDHMNKIEGNPYRNDTSVSQLPKGIRLLFYVLLGFVGLLIIGIVYGTWFY